MVFLVQTESTVMQFDSLKTCLWRASKISRTELFFIFPSTLAYLKIVDSAIGNNGQLNFPVGSS